MAHAVGLKGVSFVLGFVFGLLALATVNDADAAYRTANILPDLTNKCDDWYQFAAPKHPCWHDDEVGVFTAVDLSNGGDPADADRTVYWRQWGVDVANVVHVQFTNVTGTNCTGVRVVILSSGATGSFHYKHITPRAGVIGSYQQFWYSFPGYEERYRDLGKTAPTQPGGCLFGGPHLHQSGDTSSSSSIYTNWNAPQSYCCGTHWWWSSDTRTHWVFW